MIERRGGEMALMGSHSLIFKKLSQLLLNVLKLFVLTLFGAIILEFFSLPKNPRNFPFADADEIVLRLAALGRQGAVVLCNLQSIEAHLAVRIEKTQLLNEGFPNSDFLKTAGRTVYGIHSKSESNGHNVCRLQLRIAGHRFCDADSARMQRLLGRRVQTRLAMLDSPGFYDHGYELANDAGKRTVIGWREPSRSCPVDVEIVTASR